jgi:tetratricopeptide (TPR) repeat protein
MLDRTDVLLPGRLVWPAAQVERRRRGWLLRAEVAERHGNWQQAMACLEQAQRISAQDVSLFRARRLWLRYQQAEQLGSTDRQAADHLLAQVDEELAALAARPLTGDAMFYRSLVAASRLPERAVKDWQALLRQRQWIERAPDVAGPRLLWIGDRLRQAGLSEDALRAYRRAGELGATGAAHRLALALVQSQSVTAFDQATALDPDAPLWPLLTALTALAATPPEASVAAAQVGIARHHHAQPVLVDLVAAVCALLQNDAQAPARLAQCLAQVPAGTLPASVRACFAAILPGQSAPAVLQSLMDASAEQWTAICPVPPEALLHRAVAERIEQGQPEAALTTVRQAEQAGVALPHAVLATVLAACAVQAGLQGQFDQADHYLQQAQQLLAGSHKEGTHA